ncbi:TIGR04141 family sporadically distributed protein [Marinifilum sp. D714]|uniref:TIGR04141 family sporadically distributed protein n=1 Tax=Marinifilum sp. D714 TaxID=2937523 RepID=UPI0027C812CD|nr:TIGR04141 family sporadically distributed protein [Marinifilum sp. D714]MDQ2178787.1 TIGR04141 family sporadically distributed protein [Marinifilum sp. D714]
MASAIKDKKSISLRVCMLKSKYKGKLGYQKFMSDGLECTSYKLNPKFDIDGILLVKEAFDTQPKWKEFIQEAVEEEIKRLNSKSCSAVLFVKRKKYTLAYIFGYGRFMIDPKYLVTDFGIKTALNSIDHNSLRSVDMFSLDEQPVQKRAQAARSADMNVFGLDPTRDILKSVTGTSREDVSFRNITGGDAFFAFNSDMKFSDIAKISDQLIKLYKKDDYKENFSWVDNLRRLRNEGKIKKLNEVVLKNILEKDTSRTFLTLPEIISWDKVDGFSYTRKKGNINPSLDIRDYYDAIDVDSYNEDRLKGDKVFVHECNSTPMQFSLSKCLYTEIEEKENTYVLFMGDWFEVENDFLKVIDEELAQINQSDFPFSPVHKWREHTKKGEVIKIETEGEYNERVCKETGFYLLDKKMIKTKMMSSSIEVCDILTPKKQLIHVKHKKGGSSSLSHLFAQGYVSAESLLSDKELRKLARAKLREVHADSNMIPLDKLKSSEYEISFLILGYKSNENIATRLPFFSKINLFRINRTLQQKGFQVSIAGCGYKEIAKQ